MSPRTFSILVISSTLLLVAGSWVLSWWLEPLYGDLARLGGYAERDFGWNQSVEEYRPPITSYGAWVHPVDVLVIGDSFANLRPAQQWQNFLAERSGWSIHTVHVDRVDIDRLIASDIYMRSPPRVVIWNVIERDLVAEHGQGSETCPGRSISAPVSLLPPEPVQAHRELVERRVSLVDVNPGFARAWLYQAGRRWLFGGDTGDTTRVPMRRTDLFSSRRPGELIFYANDGNKRRWQPTDIVRVACAIEDIERRFVKNGRTTFLTAIAPDKSTAYRSWTSNPESIPESRLPQLFERLRVPSARLDQAIQEAAQRGEVDIYLPDDTHWGTAGHRVAADALFDLIASLRAPVNVHSTAAR